MADWARELRRELDSREEGLADAVGLQVDMLGPDFEKALGALWRWQDLRSFIVRYRVLSEDDLGQVSAGMARAHRNEDRRLVEVLEALNASLYRQFGSVRIDPEAAGRAYGALLHTLDWPDDLTVVTTNYDPAVEIALKRHELRPDTGFARLPGEPPVFEPKGMVERARHDPHAVAVLHLHGAVGWYEVDGAVYEHYHHLDYDPDRGRPVVLYPDPDKDPTRDAAVKALWSEFDNALSNTDKVVVIGHSLNDPVLVERLSGVSDRVRTVVCAYDESYPPDEWSSSPRFLSEAEQLSQLLRGADVVPIRFGPNRQTEMRYLGDWMRGSGLRLPQGRRARAS